MIVYKDIMGKLKSKGYSTTRLKADKVIPGSVITRIAKGMPVTTTTIDTLCSLLDCQPGDILKYEKAGE